MISPGTNQVKFRNANGHDLAAKLECLAIPLVARTARPKVLAGINAIVLVELAAEVAQFLT